MTDADLVELLTAHGWVPFAAVLVGLVVRLAKGGQLGVLVARLPKRWRPVLSVGIGVLVGTVEATAGGVAWRVALVHAAVAGLLPIVGHWLGIEVMRGGTEIPLPGDVKA